MGGATCEILGKFIRIVIDDFWSLPSNASFGQFQVKVK